MRRSRMSRVPALVCVALAVILSGCSSAATTAPTAAPASAAPATAAPATAAPATAAPATAAPATAAPSQAGDILLGAVGPLSQPGDVAGGTELKWAIEEAVKDVNASGGVLGRQIKLIFYDTQNKPDVCAQMAKRLVQDDKVVAIVGEYHSGCALAQIPEYNAAKIPVVFSETYNDKITAGDPADPNLPPSPPTIFRIAPFNTYVAGFKTDWLVNGVHAKRIVHIVDNTDFGIGSIKALKEAVGKVGIAYSNVSVELAQPDYSAVMARLKAETPDIDLPTTVVDFDLSESATGLVAIKNGIDAGLVDKAVCSGLPGPTTDATSYFRAVPNGAGCVFQYVGLSPSQYNELAKSVDARAMAQFGHGARNYAFEGYDSVMLVVDAIKRAGSTDSAAIVDALETTSYVGTQGAYAFPYNSKNPAPADQPYLWHQFWKPPLQYLEYLKNGDTLADAISVWPEELQTTKGQAYVFVNR
jgi:branched-chain amino acid transport system substrate-binding protein